MKSTIVDRGRRGFLIGAAVSASCIALPRKLFATPSSVQTLSGRFLTHVSVVRVNQIEVTPTRSIGEDEAVDNRPERIRSRREAFALGCPDGKMTWAISWLALQDQRKEYQEARRLLASYHDRYGDEITFIPGGYFAPMYDTREHNRATIHEALGLVSKMVGGGYRPQCLVAGFMDAENQRHLAEDEGIHVCQGQIWSQHGIDNGDGDGGICYPYYPSREHYLKPAQGKNDFVDCVCLDGWTCDFLTARREGFQEGFNSRLGVGPIESVGNLGITAGRKEMMDTTATHFDSGRALNGFGWVTAIWEVSIGHDDDLAWWLQAVRDRWPDTQIITEGSFGLEWRRHNPNNSAVNYTFDAKGTGAPGSEKNLEIEWFMNREFRLALLRDWTKGSPWMAIDFTRYDLKAEEPQDPRREWSLMNVLNQKGTRTQDKPLRLGQLSADDQRLVLPMVPRLEIPGVPLMGRKLCVLRGLECTRERAEFRRPKIEPKCGKLPRWPRQEIAATAKIIPMKGRPQPNEAAPYYFTYIDQVEGDNPLRSIETQLDQYSPILARITEEKSRFRYAPEKWSIRQVLNHVTDTERAFVFRALWFARGFETPLPSYDQNVSAAGAEADHIRWSAHVEEFKRVRQATISFFRNLPENAWMRKGIASDNPFTVRALGFIIPGHVAHHFRILRERYL